MSDPPQLPQAINELIVEDAALRIDTLVAVLGMAAAPTDEDVAWSTMAAASLAREGAWAGALAGDVADIPAAVASVCTAAPADRQGAGENVLALLRDARPAPVASSEDVSLDDVVAFVWWEVSRVAAQRGIALTAEVVAPAGVTMPRATGRAVVDALGLTIRHIVDLGCHRGGSIRVGFRREPDGFSITLGDRGNTESREVRGEAGGRAIDAARSRLLAIGCDVAVAAAPWGGTSVTVHVPVQPARLRFR